ncbi:MAG: hypothetical protein N3E49_09000 [Bacteroidia bacterium]|nr:hypothetical protein [Bacteroidia bacterium]
MRHVLRFIGGAVLGLGMVLGVILTLIYVSKEKLLTWVIKELGRSFSAKIQLTAVEVGSLRALPDLGLRLRDFTLQTKGGDTLFIAKRAELHLNLWQALFRENYRIQALTLEEPTVWLVYDKAGRTAWEQVFQTPERPADEPSPWALERVWVQHGRFIYRDDQADFRLYLVVSSLGSSIEGQGDKLYIQGTAEGQVERFTYRKKKWLYDQPFRLGGEITHEEGWLLFSPIRVGVAGVLMRVEGGIKLSGLRPELSLRVRSLDIDMDRVKALWQEASPWLSQLSGALKGEGEILGPVGKGKLPRLYLKAELRTDKPFSAEGYICHALYAKGRLHWDPGLPRKSALDIDTLCFIGGDADTVYLRGRYGFYSEELSASFHTRLNLTLLSQWYRSQIDSLSGLLYAKGSIRRLGQKWLLSGEGQLSEASLREAQIKFVSFKLSPERIVLTDLDGRYGQMTLKASTLSVESYARLWDSAAPPAYVTGDVYVSSLAYAPDTTQSRSYFEWGGDLSVRVDTFRWGNVVLGPIRARLVKEGNALQMKGLHLRGVGGGEIRLEGLYSPARIEGEGDFSQIDLAYLHRQLPQLDTLFPLLRHIRGIANGHFQVSLPFRGDRLAWAEAAGRLSLSLQNVIVVESPYTYELFSLVPLTDFRRIEVGRVETGLSLQEGVLRTDTTWVRANRWWMRIAGAHTLQGDLYYDLLVEVPRIVLDKSTQRVAEYIQESEGDRLRLAILITGTAENPRFSWKPAGRSLQQPSPISAPSEKQKPTRRRTLPVEER